MDTVPADAHLPPAVEMRCALSGERVRRRRVQIMARVYRDFYHVRGPAAELRNRMLGTRTPEESYDGIAWLYGSS